MPTMLKEEIKDAFIKRADEIGLGGVKFLDMIADETSATTEEEVLEFLKNRREILEGVVVTGGEPTIQDDLIDFLKKVKAMGYDIKLDSNGSKPGALKEILHLKLVDYIAMDIKSSWAHYDEVAGVKVDREAIKESIEVIQKIRESYFPQMERLYNSIKNEADK